MSVDCDRVFASGRLAGITRYPDLEGRHVFITGGGSGIGAYFTAAFALQGARVSFLSTRPEPAQLLCDDVEEHTGIRPRFYRCDIRNLTQLRDALDQAVADAGPIHVLLNNAARDTRHNLESLSPEAFDDAINTNLRPQFFAIQAVAPDMAAAGGGAVINVGSNSANLALSGYPAYVTSKSAIIGMTRSLARELGPDNIRVNALVPGWVMTERQQRLWVTEEALQECIDEQNLKFAIQGEDVAESALFLASQASRAISGQSLIIDGGRV
ncbi:SDR family NAD(P)-dependent oxidoreductase [Biformimicrobium ophioploci]|uniref:SDR family oxidoreductase n=1 Tax=Biformimicrobium ophioploci TaxID=3036711 RepID=A0ABQ6LVT3_9GAMM|nr:SDR family oxidoreductase [Microbulbifer sp. NKW57]GMG86142.1 SDR family oxidoreductase [Microbulbifer sp. NKW57]